MELKIRTYGKGKSKAITLSPVMLAFLDIQKGEETLIVGFNNDNSITLKKKV